MHHDFQGQIWRLAPFHCQFYIAAKRDRTMTLATKTTLTLFVSDSLRLVVWSLYRDWVWQFYHSKRTGGLQNALDYNTADEMFLTSSETNCTVEKRDVLQRCHNTCGQERFTHLHTHGSKHKLAVLIPFDFACMAAWITVIPVFLFFFFHHKYMLSRRSFFIVSLDKVYRTQDSVTLFRFTNRQ